MAFVGHVDAISRAGVSGWAGNPDDKGSPVTVSVIVNGRERGSGQADQPRPGLATNTKGIATDTSGFRVDFEPPLSPFHDWRIEVVDPATRKPLVNGVQTLPAPSRDGSATPTPIVITSTGRTGTTLLMAEFARSKDIVLADRYPYEIKQIAYYAAVFRTLAASAGRARSADPDTMLSAARLHSAGSNPYNAPGFFDLAQPGRLMQTYYESHVPAQYAQLFRSLILEYYAILRVSQGKAAAPYFCEEGDLQDAARQAARLFFPRVRELLVVRDPRDLLATAMSVWKLAPAEALQALRAAAPQLLEIHRRREPDVLTVRYEDLLLDPVGSRAAMSGFLGIEIASDLPAPDNAALAAQRTSRDTIASIGRWRQELTAEQIDACGTAFRDYMAAFDYLQADAAGAAAPKPAPAAATAPPSPPPAVAAAAAAGASPRRSGLIIAVEGSVAVNSLRAASTDETADGRPMRPVARLEFGRGNPGAAQLGPGWSRPEHGYVWSNAHQCHLALPALGDPGVYRVWLAAAPFVDGEKLPAQTVTVLVNAIEIGTVALRLPALLAFDLPPTEIGGRIALTLRLPNAARPRELGTNADDRLIALSLRWVTVLWAEPAPGAGAPA